MIEIEKPQIECIEIARTMPPMASMSIEPLERGYGTTLGNCAAAHHALLLARHGGHQPSRSPACSTSFPPSPV